MNSRPPQERKKKKRGRSRTSITFKKSKIRRNSDNEGIVVIGSSPESYGSKPIILLSDSSEETTKCLNTMTNSVDMVIDSVVAGSRCKADNGVRPKMKDLRVVLTRAEEIPGLMGAKNRGNSSKFSNKKPITKAISISSSSMGSDWSMYRTTPKKSKKSKKNVRRSKALGKIKEIAEECSEKNGTAKPLNFGEGSTKAVKIEEESMSNCTASIASSGKFATAKRKRSNGECKVHPFFIELSESSRNQRSRKSTKRSRKDNGERKDKLCKQLENQTFINGKLGLSKDPMVSRADDSKAPKSDVFQSDKLIDTVDNSTATRSIQSARDIIGIVSGNKSIVSDKENSGSSGKDENIVALESIAEKAVVSDVEAHCDDLCSLLNGDGRIVGLTDLPTFLDGDTDAKMINDLETNANEVLTLFSASDIGTDDAIDKESCTLDSISRAIDKDVAGGNRLSPILSDLLPFSSTSDNEENRVEETKRRLNGSSKSNESFHTSPAGGEFQVGLGNGTETFENNAMRKRPAITDVEILPKGSTINLQTIRDNRRRKKFNQTIVPPVSRVDENRNADIREINAARDKNISVSETELEALLLNENSANNNSSTSVKDDCNSEDVLNNNRGTIVTNKNDINFDKRQNTITMYSAPAEPDVGTLKDQLDDMERLLEGGDTNLLINGSADVETRSEVVDASGCDIMRALEEYGNANDISFGKAECSKNAEDGKAEQINTLTIKNLDAFNDCVAENKITSAIRRETIDTDVSSPLTDVTGCTTESGKNRKRKWVSNGEAPNSAKSSGSKIILNRRKWAKMSLDATEKSIDHEVEAKEPLAKLSLIDDGKSDIENPVIAETVSVINEISRKLISPIMENKEWNNGMGIVESGNVYNRATSTPTKNSIASAIDGDESDSSDSSSSDSNTSSSSSSSSDDESSEECDNQDATNNIRINGENDETTMRKDDESRESNFVNEAIQTTLIPEEDEVLPSFGSNAVPLEMRIETAGSLIDDGNCPENSEDDKSDCISLDTESLCMSRCESPEPPRRKASVVSPTKRQKPGNVKSRLGPRVDVQTPSNTTTKLRANKQSSQIATNNIIRIKTAANNVEKIQHVANNIEHINTPVDNLININPAACQIQVELNAPNALRIYPEITPLIEQVPLLKSEKDVETLLKGHCYGWLKSSNCWNPEQCRYQHRLHHSIMYHLGNVTNHQWIIGHAVRCQYRHFFAMVQKFLMIKMAPHRIIEFCFYLCGTRFINHYHFLNIIVALETHGLTLLEIVELFAVAMQNQNIESSIVIMEELCKILESGTRWKTLKGMIMQFPVTALPRTVVLEVLNESVKIYPVKSHLDDVWENLISKLPTETVGEHGDLFKEFYDLRKAFEFNVPTAETTSERNLTCGIASPDSPRESEREQEFHLPFQFETHASASSPTPVVQSQTLWSNAIPSTSSGNESRGAVASETSNSYSLKSIDQLPPPSSAYGDSIWKFHVDLQAVREGLKHRDYDYVINVLTVNQSDPNRLPHMAGFYSILCKEIMSSRHHLDEIVRRAVQSGASDELHRYIYDLGVYVLTSLADAGAWILAYGLLKTFKVYGHYNTCAYTLLSAEICIANHRPLKALALLKQSGLVFSNQRRWNQMWCPDDEPLRVSVMELLLISLCDGHAAYALALLEFILKEQCSSFKPINISRHIDRIAGSLLAEKRTDAVVDFGRLLIENNLFVDPTIFRAVINRVFHSDQFLAKQLHRYATWLGAYNMPKISGITHMIVNIDWTEEEMYLMFSSLIYELYVNIGHAIDRLRPRQLAVYLILEAMPTERQLWKDASEPPLSKVEINRRRAMVKKVCDRFDPKIKVIQKAQGKFCKIRSESLVNYLKSGHFK